jgi:ADP-heptose:LPS heptosyltransferase
LFGLPAPEPTPLAPVTVGDGRLRIGILPLASSPIRTLPPALILDLNNLLGGDGMEVHIVLNPQQNQSKTLRSALDAAVPDLRYAEDTRSVADLLALMRQFDYAVFADSGPAHLSKLEQRPGAAIFTSAPSDLLLGRHRNLKPIQAIYSSNYCEAPCGLAKLRQTSDGRVGCMASLGVDRRELPSVVDGPDESLIRRFLLQTPIPCVAVVAATAGQIAQEIRADLFDRQPLI